MIRVVLADGTQRNLAEAEVTLTWKAPEDETVETSYTLEDVKALMVFDPVLGTMAGALKGMPIMGLAFTDDGDTGIRVEVPVPLGFANDLGHQLVKETDRFAAAIKLAGGDSGRALKRFQTLPADLGPPPGS
jgi:hypothetical protein